MTTLHEALMRLAFWAVFFIWLASTLEARRVPRPPIDASIIQVRLTK